MVAQFVRYYGMETFRGTWPTADRVIPWGAFWALYEQIPCVQALERINETIAVNTAIALAFGDSSRTGQIISREESLAFPKEVSRGR